MTILHLYPQPHVQTAGRVIDDEAVLILSDVNEVVVLNSVGARIFELADGTHSVAQIADVIAAEFDVASADAEADVVTFVNECVAQHVLMFSAEPTP